MVSTGEFLLQMLQTKDAPILLDAIVLISRKLGKYAILLISSIKGLCWKYHDLDQNIEIW